MKLYMEEQEIKRGDMLARYNSVVLSAISKEVDDLVTIDTLASYVSKFPLIKSSSRDYSGVIFAQ